MTFFTGRTLRADIASRNQPTAEQIRAQANKEVHARLYLLNTEQRVELALSASEPLTERHLRRLSSELARRADALERVGQDDRFRRAEG